ncbi:MULTISPECIES: flavocytochrome c [unclassified Oceanispirochaeta]|uniref:flavocytochrome c n=1 Tax=unclassified Oceanispirochaeta TaxID=2635722 RepID=UPI000E098D56|nr:MULTISPECIES: flavocytochrome c [unclassified Oceanispirochaeta]MBF9015121.1 flavocytochrome c [Oceanispirochaeta sp. M2]NPD71579.1 flavocytochrome c [Oceanispirochaeta sp. M1]RDG33147.1 flavocytochrome c [Oceanispirochaeta sp. M1]
MKTKKIKFLLLAVVSAFTLIACGQSSSEVKSAQAVISPMKAGVYTETVKGIHEGLVVEVTLTENAIKDVKIIKHAETDGVSDVALEKMPSKIVEAQSVAVDTISGATYTSKGILSAVSAAIEEAGGKVAEFMNVEADTASATSDRPVLGSPSIPKKWDMSYDVVVVGGGFAGLAATHSAQNSGADTLLIEKMPFVGGNSQINGGVYASYTSNIAADLQKELNLVPDTAEKHIEDVMMGGDYQSDIKLVKNFVYGGPFYFNLLLDNGLKVRETLTRPGGHYGYRTYTTINGVGRDIVKVQVKMVKESGATVMVRTKMTEIYRDTKGECRVVGIRVETEDGIKNIEAKKGLIITTGGFAGNIEMRSKHVPALTDALPTTNHVGATGEGIQMAQEVGANTLHMSYIQLYPFANPNTGGLDAYAVIPFSGPSSGIVYVDRYGKRYVNEGERRDVCSKAAQDTQGFSTFSIFDEKIVKFGGFIAPSQLANGIKNDRIYKADTLEELAAMINERTYQGETINMDGKDLVETIRIHNGYVKNGSDPDFGKVIDKGVMMTIDQGPFYAIPQWPSVHHTMGGVAITPKTEVQDIWGNVIPGLYAAGEVVGGVHGTNRLGSNAIPDAVSHGYISGQVCASGTVPDFVPAN